MEKQVNIGGSSISKVLISILEVITAILLFSMMILTFIDVIGRYLFNAPVYGAAEIIQILLIGVIFSAMPIVSKTNSHIAVELFSPSISKKIPKTHSLVVNLFSVCGLLVISGEIFRVAVDAYEIGKTTIVLEWPLIIILVPTTIFCLIAAAFQASWLLRGEK